MLKLKLPVLIFVISLLHTVSSCLKNALPPEEWVSGAEIEEFRIRDRSDERALFLVARDFVFGCEGTIQQWIIRWQYRDTSPRCAVVQFFFYVLRQSQECGLTTIEGHNLFSVTVGESTDQKVESVFNVDPDQRIRVQEGDFVAVTMALKSLRCPDIRARIAGLRGVDNTVYYGSFSGFSEALFAGLIRPCSSYTQNELLKPFFTAVVDRISTTTPPDPEPQPPSTSIIEGQQSTKDPKPTVTSTSGVHTSRMDQPTTSSSYTAVIKKPNATGSAPTEVAVETGAQDLTSQGRKIRSTTTTTTTITDKSIERSLQGGLSSYGISSAIQPQYLLNSTGMNTSTNEGKSEDKLLLIAVGGGSCGLFLIIITITTTVLCLLRYLKYKRKGEDSMKQEGNAISRDSEQPRIESQYEDPHNFRAELGRHIHGFQDSMKINTAYGSANLEDLNHRVRHPVEDLREHQISTSLQEGHSFIMSINGAYGSLTTP